MNRKKRDEKYNKRIEKEIRERHYRRNGKRETKKTLKGKREIRKTK